MKLGPKYKIARRLGAPVFEKTQTAKYAQSLARKEKNMRRRPRRPSEYGTQLLEKQKARYTYYLSESQFRKYVDKALHAPDPAQALFRTLESRLDNVIYRAGFAKTRIQARQMASHGLMTVNGRRVTIPSILLKKGDVVGVREASKEGALFRDAAERMKSTDTPAWIKLDAEKMEATVDGEATYTPGEQVFDLSVVFEFYSR